MSATVNLKTPKKILVGLSGGVDSAVVAALLKQEGYLVEGLTMKIWDENSGIEVNNEKVKHACFGPGEHEDLADAKAICDKLGIPLHVIDLSREYREEVLEYFKSEYLLGRTPNPCVRCNHRMKFGFLVEKALQSGLKFDCFATGHYAKTSYNPDNGRHQLIRGSDKKKDQSYFLVFLSQEQLGRAMFPLGEQTKEKTFAVARELGLHVSEKKESQDFIEGGDYTVLFDEPSKPGPILTEKGEEIGQHRGIINYTIGQRKGLGVCPTEPVYVTKIDSEKNAVIVGSKTDLLKKSFLASNLNWISINPPSETISAQVKIRQTHKEAEALIKPLANGTVEVEFVEPQMIATPGQICVFYAGDLVLGGGIIESPL